MDWPFPLPSYSCSEITNKIWVNSIVQGIKAAKKSVYYSLLTYNSLWTPGLRFRALPIITLLFLQLRGTGGYWSFRLSHWSLLPSYRLPLCVLLCVIVTIRDFVFSSVFSWPFFTGYFGCSVFPSAFWQIWPLSVFLRKIPPQFDFLKIYF